VTISADLSVVKTCLTAPVTADYQSNTHSGSQCRTKRYDGVIINDAVPAQILNPQYATSLSGPWSTWTGSYNAGALIANASTTLYIQGTLDPLATVSITNTAIITTVNGDATDPDLSNNVSTTPHC